MFEGLDLLNFIIYILRTDYIKYNMGVLQKIPICDLLKIEINF